MATIGRKGDFGYLNDNLLELQKEKDWLFITEDTSLINKYHFKKYDYYYGLVIKNTKIISAYSIYYYALYKGLKFFVENVIKNGWCFKKYDTTLDVPIIDIKES